MRFGYHKRLVLWYDYHCDDSLSAWVLMIPGCRWRLPSSYWQLQLLCQSFSYKLVSQPLSKTARDQKVRPSLSSTASRQVPRWATLLPWSDFELALSEVLVGVVWVSGLSVTDTFAFSERFRWLATSNCNEVWCFLLQWRQKLYWGWRPHVLFFGCWNKILWLIELRALWWCLFPGLVRLCNWQIHGWNSALPAF